LMDNRAQISAEYLVVMAAILAVALILVLALKSTATGAKSKLASKSTTAVSEIGKIK
jgi:uncharacterized protein (UPF0333 family)